LNSKWLLLLAVLLTILIIYLSISDISNFPELEMKHEDKYYHVVAYFFLNLMWLFSVIPYKLESTGQFLLISSSIIVFGIVIEVIQESITDYRVFDIFDILANSIGVTASFICFMFVKKKFFKNINSNSK
jgi:VanZ family protein